MTSKPDHPDLPTGTVTFLFTDIEGSTRLVAALGEAYGPVLEAHTALIRSAVAEHGGTEVGTEGDGMFAVFPSALAAVRAAADAQRRLAAHPWPHDVSVRVRMGLHTGEGRLGGDDYVGIDVHRASRIAASGHGGQVLLSDATRTLVEADLPAGLHVRSLGEHGLKDLPSPVPIWQLVIEGLPGAFPPIRSMHSQHDPIPVPATPLIGREVEVTDVADLVAGGSLLTLTGPGGTGKTRIALAAAERLTGRFADGIVFVALQDTHDPETVAAAVAGALGIRERPDRDLVAGIREHLREREMLLILDNFEQVLSAVSLVADLLTNAPRLHVMVTSRAVLHLAAEQTYEVPPLRTPDTSDLPPFAELSRYEAITLFVERARAADRSFSLDAENARPIVGICRRLDGLPLAIELAAARTRLLAPAAILDRLERHLPVLVGGPTDVPLRQRTLDAAIGWSHQLLDPAERTLFERLSVFAGGWTIQTAEAVCNPGSALAIDTFDGLGSLADASLIRPLGSHGTEARFDMLQVIREYALARFAGSPDAADIQRRHAMEMVQLAEDAEPELRSSALRSWQHRLRREQDNLRAALRWAIDVEDASTCLRIAAALWDYWHYWAELREGVRWLETCLRLPGALTPSLDRAKALRALAGLLYWQGDADRAFMLYEESLAVVRELGDDRLVAGTLQDSAWAALARDDLPTAIARAAEGEQLFRDAGDEASAELMSAWLALAPVVTGKGGDIGAAIDAAKKGLEINRRLGRSHDVADYLEATAMLYRVIGDADRAEEAGRDTLRLWDELGTLGRLPLGLKLLAAVEILRGRPQRAVRLGAAAERYNDEIGGELADAVAQLGDPVEEARPMLAAADHARAVADGRGMSIEEQIAYALG